MQAVGARFWEGPGRCALWGRKGGARVLLAHARGGARVERHPCERRLARRHLNPGSDEFAKTTPGFSSDDWLRNIPLGRIGATEDIAEVPATEAEVANEAG